MARAQTLLKLHREHGPIVRVGPNEVSFGDWRLYKFIYGGNISTTKTNFYDVANFLGYNNIFTFRDKDQHRSRRKMESHPYSQQSIMSNEELIASKAVILARRIIREAASSASGKTFEAYSLCGLFSLEVVLKCAFNRDCEESIDGFSSIFLGAMDEGSTALAMQNVFPFLIPAIGQFLPGSLGHSYRQFKRWHSMTQTLFDEFKSKSDSKDAKFLITPLIVKKDDYLQRHLTEAEIVEEAMGIAFAGSGTTSSTMTYLIYALSRPDGQEAQHKLRQELKGSGASLKDLQRLPYLDAVIKETMRLYPTIISTLPRHLDDPVSLDQNGLVFPKGTVIGMQNYVHQRDETLFPEPDKFLPDRWLDKSASQEMHAALTPFSIGSRNCLGQNLAKAELLLATSEVFRHLHMTVNPATTPTDMEMCDRFNVFPSARRLLVDIEVL